MSQNRKRKSYGSIDDDKNDDFITSCELTEPEDIINQTYFKCSYIVEPVLFLCNFAISTIGICYSQFIYMRILNRILEQSLYPIQNSTSYILYYLNDNYTTTTTTSMLTTTTPASTNNDNICNMNSSSNQNSSFFDAIRIKAQQEAANINFICSLVGGIPCVFTTNILGVNCSKIGRKPLIILGIIVMILKNITYLFLAIFPNLPDYTLYIVTAIDGLIGGYGVFLLTLHCYIADTIPAKSRSYRITLVNYMGAINSILVSSIAGYIIKKYGYIPLFASSLIFYFVALLYAIILVPETLVGLKSKSIFKRIKSMSLLKVTNCFKVLLRKYDPIVKINKNQPECGSETANNDEVDRLIQPSETNNNQVTVGRKRQRSVIVLITVANLVYCFGTTGVSCMFTLFLMNTPFCWNSVDISAYSVYCSIGGLVISLLVSKFLRINDILICVLSVLSYFIALFFYGFATKTIYIYIGSGVAFISGLEFGYVRSKVTKLVTKYETADALTLITLVDTLTNAIASILFNYLYGRLVSYKTQLIFFIISFIILIVLIIHTCAYIITILEKRKSVNETVEDTEPLPIESDPVVVDSNIEKIDSLVSSTQSLRIVT